MIESLPFLLKKYSTQFHAVVDFNAATDKLVLMDMSETNKKFAASIAANPALFSSHIAAELAGVGAKYGVGGYLEERIIYNQLKLFQSPGGKKAENRTIHLGIDIWGKAGTIIKAPWGGTIHSVSNLPTEGGYGSTVILQHQLEGFTFHTLYGHLAASCMALNPNQYICFGEPFATFGLPAENGNWPPHLHFQIIIDMELKEGDYPGVCSKSNLAYYEKNCPDPDMILSMMKHVLIPD